MLCKYVTIEEARTLAELGPVVYNRYRNTDLSSNWNTDWSEWKAVTDWEAQDWDYVSTIQWEDEFRVEVE